MKVLIKKFVVILWTLGIPGIVFAGSDLLELQSADSALLLLEKSTHGIRNEALLRSDQRPPQVVSEYADDPADDWTQVRWVFRFPLAKTMSSVSEARLFLWAQSSGPVNVTPKIEVIQGGQGPEILAADRTAQALGESMDFEYPATPSVVELDVTEFVNRAIKNGCSYAAFRISAVSDQPLDLETGKTLLNFGGCDNVWNWPENHAPSLQITTD